MTTPPISEPLPFRSFPVETRAGDAITFELDVPEIPLPLVAPVTLSYVLTGVVAGVATRIIVSAGDIALDVDEYTVSIPSSETKTWTPGFYLWIAYLTDTNSNRAQLAQGRVKITPNVAGSATPVDPRSMNERTLWAIDQLIAGRAVADVQMYEVSGRKLEKMTIKDLMFFRGIVAGWVRRERKSRGEYVRPNRVGVTFGGSY